MANRKMTLSKTKLAQSVSNSLSTGVKTLSLAAALLLGSQNAAALGLGALQVESNLDQPLSGSIELRVAEGDDLDTLTAVIASKEDFESLGIDYPSYLKDFSLLLDTLDGNRRLRVTSNNVIIKEPFIHFLVRVEWSGGSFLREYTALIDPPVYAAESPSSVAIPREVGTDQTYQPETQEPSYEEPEVAVDDIVSEELPVEEDEPLIDDNFYNDDVNDSATSAQASTEYSATIPTDATYGPVESGESLSLIAQDLQAQFPDLSIYQIMKVLFDENESSFIQGNINGLIKGSILRIGDLEAILSVDIAQSKAFYTQQINDWNPEYLQASTNDSLNVGQDNYNFGDSSDDSGLYTDDSFGSDDSFQVGASTESDDFLSSDQGDNREGEVLALRQEVASLESSLASSELEKQELNERISLLEGRLADMNRLAELSVESADLASIEATLADQNAAEDEGFSSDDSDLSLSDGTSAIDEFLTDSSDDLGQGADSLADEASDAIDGLIDGATEDTGLEGAADAIGEFVDGDGSGSEAELADGFESVIEEAQEASDTAADAVEEAVTAAPVTITTPKSESIIDKVKSAVIDGGLWKVLAGIGALLAAGAGLLFMRRRRADEEFEISMLSIESNSHSVGHSGSTAASASMSMSHTASVASEENAADKETSFLTVYSDSDAVVQADEVDPVAEADVYIAYGRDEQAEEVLLDGVVSHPDRVDIKQKLLNLYHKRQNAEGFERIAEELYSQRAALTGDVWARVCEMGKEVAPANPLFDLSGDDLNTAVEVDSELNVDDVPAAAEISDSDEPTDTKPEEAESVDHLDEPLTAQTGELEEALTIDDESEMVVGSLNDDESIQLINFDDGRSEISELDDVEIDALELSGDIPNALDLSTAQTKEENEEAAASDDDDALEFDFDQAVAADEDVAEKDDGDIEKSVSEVAEVSDLEIDADYDEARTQYELAKVFVDLGDEDGARKILDELVGSDQTSEDVRADSQALLDSIS